MQIPDSTKFYAMAIIPGDPVYSQLVAYKNRLAENCTMAYSHQHFFPHIEIFPAFNWSINKEYLLVDCMKKYVWNCFSFDIELNGFDISKDKSELYLKVDE